MTKKFKLTAENIRTLIPEIGHALATDRIMVDGCKVGYMVRRDQSEPGDSGWEFYSGDETQEYIDDPNHWGVYSVNTVANYDPEIIRFLSYPAGSKIERRVDGNLTPLGSPDQPLVVLYPAVEPGTVYLKNWQFGISETMFRRADQGDLVLWRPGLTIWISAYKSEAGESQVKADELLKNISPDHTNLDRSSSGTLAKLRYRLTETVDGSLQNGVYIHAFSTSQEIHLAAYYDEDGLMSECDLIWDSLNKLDD